MRGAGVEVVGWWVGKKLNASCSELNNASSSELRGGVVRGIGGDIYGEGSRACQQGLWCSVELRLPLNHFPSPPPAMPLTHLGHTRKAFLNWP